MNEPSKLAMRILREVYEVGQEAWNDIGEQPNDPEGTEQARLADQAAARVIDAYLPKVDADAVEGFGIHGKYHRALLDLLAVIHRDGGHRTKEIGIDLSIEQAMQRSSERIAALSAMPDPLAMARAMQARCAVACKEQAAIIGALPHSSIHSALSGAADAIAAIDPTKLEAE